MVPKVLKKKIIISNKLGLHARAASTFVNHASRYGSEIQIIKGDQSANGKSIMGVLLLAASIGTELEITISGGDEAAMMRDLETLINGRFGEEE